jgi:epoxyqueuosine reductase QueG
MMGFPLELSKKGLIKVKNQSPEAAIDIIMTLQEEELKKNPNANAPPKATIKIVSYTCMVCTFVNPDGASLCEICQTSAPQTAYIIEKSQDEIKREKDEEEAKIKKELEEIDRIEKERIAKEEEDRKKDEEERLLKEKEEQEARIRDELKVKTHDYFADV